MNKYRLFVFTFIFGCSTCPAADRQVNLFPNDACKLSTILNLTIDSMILVPILIDEDKTKEIYANPDCREIFNSYPEYYFKTGYNPPWIGYFVIREGKVVGVGGFIGKPKDGKVEIAYGTFKDYEGQGIASFSCLQLITIAKETDPKIIITAKTSPEQNASTKILQRNGFKFTGTVQDEGIGDAWEWILTE